MKTGFELLLEILRLPVLAAVVTRDVWKSLFRRKRRPRQDEMPAAAEPTSREPQQHHGAGTEIIVGSPPPAELAPSPDDPDTRPELTLPDTPRRMRTRFNAPVYDLDKLTAGEPADESGEDGYLTVAAEKGDDGDFTAAAPAPEHPPADVAAPAAQSRPYAMPDEDEEAGNRDFYREYGGAYAAAPAADYDHSEDAEEAGDDLWPMEDREAEEQEADNDMADEDAEEAEDDGEAQTVPLAAPGRRYANVECLADDGSALLNARMLPPGRLFTLRLGIDALKDSSLVRAPQPFPDDRVPPDIFLDVILTSQEFEIAATAAADFSGSAQSTLFLPGKGGAATGPDGRPFVDFRMKIPVAGEAACHISFQFRGAVIQSLLLKKAGETAGGAGAFSVDHVFSLSSKPADLAVVPERSRLSLLTAARKEGANQIILYARDGSAVQSDIFDIDIAGLTATLRGLRAALEERAPTARQRSRRDLELDLRAIAPFGAELFQRLPGQNFSKLGPLLDDPDNTVIHIARATSAEFVAPWSLIYDIPLTEEMPKLCEIVSDWDGISPLVAAGARSCPHAPHAENILCPFGFWGLRYTIEQLVSTEKPSTEIVVSGACNIVAAQTLYDVDAARLDRHFGALRDIFNRRLPAAVMQIGRDKTTVRALMGQDLPFVYFYCHGERDNDASPDVYLGIGNREKITTSDFGSWLWAWFKNQRLKVWDKTRPLVFINACNSAAIYPETLISYVNAFVGRAEAAGVIGTEAKVSQALAMAFAESFFTRLLDEGSTVETALRDVRMDYLSAGNLFGLVYTPYCWADLHVAGIAPANDAAAAVAKVG